MSLKRRVFTKEFKQQVLREIEAGKSLAQAAREHQLHPNCIGDWKRQAARYGAQAFAGNGNIYKEEAKIAELERLTRRDTRFLNGRMDYCHPIPIRPVMIGTSNLERLPLVWNVTRSSA